eukprot:NODE_34_length_36538_cov_0.612854.p21 type:complete len:156 gc:universal NODE_34_length_36538_cov_0.612854:22677-23144(+)
MGRKSKARKLVRQTRRLQDAHHKHPKPVDKLLKERWSKGEYRQQLQNLGLEMNVNDVKMAELNNAITALEPIERTDSEFIQSLSNLEGRTSYFYLSENECVTLNALIKKHGRNVDSMFKDIDLNVMQWSTGQLRKKINKLEKELNLLELKKPNVQ